MNSSTYLNAWLELTSVFGRMGDWGRPLRKVSLVHDAKDSFLMNLICVDSISLFRQTKFVRCHQVNAFWWPLTLDHSSHLVFKHRGNKHQQWDPKVQSLFFWQAASVWGHNSKHLSSCWVPWDCLTHPYLTEAGSSMWANCISLWGRAFENRPLQTL